MDLKTGSRWKSAVCAAEVVVVRPSSAPATLACGGHPMTAPGGEAARLAKQDVEGEVPQMGKRYFDAASGLEILCSKGGEGALSFDGRPLKRKEAKQLPSSD